MVTYFYETKKPQEAISSMVGLIMKIFWRRDGFQASTTGTSSQMTASRWTRNYWLRFPRHSEFDKSSILYLLLIFMVLNMVVRHLCSNRRSWNVLFNTFFIGSSSIPKICAMNTNKASRKTNPYKIVLPTIYKCPLYYHPLTILISAILEISFPLNTDYV